MVGAGRGCARAVLADASGRVEERIELGAVLLGHMVEAEEVARLVGHDVRGLVGSAALVVGAALAEARPRVVTEARRGDRRTARDRAPDAGGARDGAVDADDGGRVR